MLHHGKTAGSGERSLNCVGNWQPETYYKTSQTNDCLQLMKPAEGGCHDYDKKSTELQQGAKTVQGKSD